MEEQIVNLYRNEEYESCIFLCRMQLQINCNSKIANDYLAYCLMKVGRYEESIEMYNKMINKEVDFVIDQDSQLSYHVFRGDCYYKLGRYQEAISNFTEALKIDPYVGSTWQRVAEAYFMMGDFEEAHINIDRAIKMSNGYRDTLVMKALFFKFQGKDIEASHMFSEIKKIYPDDDLVVDQQFEILAKKIKIPNNINIKK